MNSNSRKPMNPSGIHVWLILMKAHQALEKHALQSLTPAPICFSDFVILEALLHKGPLPVNRLGGKLFLTSGSLTAAVDRLEKSGLVERQAHPTDRRARIVHLTPAGTALISELFDRHAAYFETITDVLTPTERDTLTHLLKKLGKHAEALLTED
jgi:MarR family 2-MHQ and catechol resistance regulon transcriptional repressor